MEDALPGLPRGRGRLRKGNGWRTNRDGGVKSPGSVHPGAHPEGGELAAVERDLGDVRAR